MQTYFNTETCFVISSFMMRVNPFAVVQTLRSQTFVRSAPSASRRKVKFEILWAGGSLNGSKMVILQLELPFSIASSHWVLPFEPAENATQLCLSKSWVQQVHCIVTSASERLAFA